MKKRLDAAAWGEATKSRVKFNIVPTLVDLIEALERDAFLTTNSYKVVEDTVNGLVLILLFEKVTSPLLIEKMLSDRMPATTRVRVLYAKREDLQTYDTVLRLGNGLRLVELLEKVEE